jgi:hypothetical protein
MFGTIACMILICLAVVAAFADPSARADRGLAALAVAAITCGILELAMAINRRR